MEPVWRLFFDDGGNLKQEAPSADAVRAAVEADPGAAARRFAAPAGWTPTEGAPARLRPGLDEKQGLRAGEVATVARVYSNGDIEVKRVRDGKRLKFFKPADLVHGFDGSLPLAAACALGASADAVVVLAEAAPDAVGADGRNPLPLAAEHGRSAGLLRQLLGVNAAWAKSVDADGKSPFQLLKRSASDELAFTRATSGIDIPRTRCGWCAAPMVPSELRTKFRPPPRSRERERDRGAARSRLRLRERRRSRRRLRECRCFAASGNLIIPSFAIAVAPSENLILNRGSVPSGAPS